MELNNEIAGFGYEDEKYDDMFYDNPIPRYNITFTINNYNDKHIDFMKSLNFKYLIMYGEVGKKRGTPHIQGFISLDINGTKKRIKTIQRQMIKYAGSGCWARPSRGSAIDNKIYCEKEGLLICELGNIKLCGKGSQERNLVDLKAQIDNGTSIDAMWKDPDNFQLMIQYGKRLKDYVKACQSFEEYERNRYTDGVYIHGATGVGKSTKLQNFINKYYDKKKVAKLTYGGVFYSPYNNQPVVVLDDAKLLETKDLLNLINTMPWDMNQKNGWKMFNSRMVILLDKNNIDERFSATSTSYLCGGDGVPYRPVKCEATFEVKRRFKCFNFEIETERKELFKYLKQKFKEYEDDNNEDIIVDDEDYDD